MNLRTIGEKLQNKRKTLGLSIDEVANNTKIRKSYILAIENNDFSKFDSHVYAKGFIKNYANFLALDSRTLLAIYRRDYQNVSIKRTVNNDIKNKEVKKPNLLLFKKPILSPRQFGLLMFTFVLIILVIFVITFVNKAFTPPYIKLINPVEISGNSSQVLDFFDNQLIIKGETQASVLIKINDVPIPLKSGYQFESAPFPITSAKSIFIVTATSQVGVVSTIKIELNKKTITNQKTFNGIDSNISILKDNAILNVKADDVVQFDGEVHANDEFPIKGKNKLEIKTSKPLNIKLVINNLEYKLTKTNEIFDYKDGKVTQR